MYVSAGTQTALSRASAPPGSCANVEQTLLLRYREGDTAARDELVRRLMPLGRRLAGRYRNTSQAGEDLGQIAYVGLIKAIDRYAAERGPFLGSVVPYVLGELKRQFRDKGRGVHVPRSPQDRFLTINAAIEQLSGPLGRSPTVKEVANHTGYPLEEVYEALEVYADRTVGDGLGSDDDRYDLVELDATVMPTFGAMPKREQTILRLRFREGLTQSEIATRVGISQMHVFRLLRRSLERLSMVADAQAASNAAPPEASAI